MMCGFFSVRHHSSPFGVLKLSSKIASIFINSILFDGKVDQLVHSGGQYLKFPI